MRTTLTRALVGLGLGLAGALFLGAGAAVAQTADDSSSSSYLAECCRARTAARAPTPSAGPRRALRGRAAGQSQPRRLKMAYRVRLTTSIRARAKGYPNTQRSSGMWAKFMP
jgi:hypothetical protein